MPRNGVTCCGLKREREGKGERRERKRESELVDDVIVFSTSLRFKTTHCSHSQRRVFLSLSLSLSLSLNHNLISCCFPLNFIKFDGFFFSSSAVINGVEYCTGIHNNKKKSKQLAAEGERKRERERERERKGD